MATPMHVYYEVAVKYGKVDYNDSEAVSHFFREILPTLSPDIREKIAEELLERNGEKAKSVPKRSFPKDAPAILRSLK